MIDAIDGKRFRYGKRSPDGSDDGLLTILAKSRLIRGMIFALLTAIPSSQSDYSPTDQPPFFCENNDLASQQAMKKLSQLLVQYQQSIIVGNLLMATHQKNFDQAKQFCNPAELSALQTMMAKRRALALEFSQMVDRTNTVISQDCDASRLYVALDAVLAQKFQENWPKVISLDEQIISLLTTIARRALQPPCSSGADTTCL